MKQSKIVGEPTPKHVLEAMNTIREYLKAGGWVQVIINAEGGAVFKLTDIYEDMFSSFAEAVEADAGPQPESR
jgi:hypothetical protein